MPRIPSFEPSSTGFSFKTLCRRCHHREFHKFVGYHYVNKKRIMIFACTREYPSRSGLTLTCSGRIWFMEMERGPAQPHP